MNIIRNALLKDDLLDRGPSTCCMQLLYSKISDVNKAMHDKLSSSGILTGTAWHEAPEAASSH